MATLNDVTAANVSVQANVNFTAVNASAGLFARASGSGIFNMYLGQLTKLADGVVQATIYRFFHGVGTRISTVQKLAGTEGSLIFQVEGPSLKLFLNGKLVAFAQDTTLTGGGVGIYGNRGGALANFQADSVNLASAGVPFNDLFANPTLGYQLSESWLERNGNFNLSNGVALAQTPGANLATLNGLLQTDVDLQGTFLLTGLNQMAGLVARYSGPGDSNMYLGSLRVLASGKYQAGIYKNVHGIWTLLATKNLTHFGGTLRFQVIGNHLSLSVDGDLFLSRQDSSIRVPGMVGMRVTAGVAVQSFSAN